MAQTVKCRETRTSGGFSSQRVLPVAAATLGPNAAFAFHQIHCDDFFCSAFNRHCESYRRTVPRDFTLFIVILGNLACLAPVLRVGKDVGQFRSGK